MAGLACLLIGAASMIAMLIWSAIRGELAMLPPLVYTVPPAAIAAGLAIAAAARRESSWKLPALGTTAATAAIFAGWFAVIAGVVLGVALLFWLVSELAG